MKTKLLLLSFLMLFLITTNYAQTSASQAGIAVQGIARDSNNSALASQSISFTFTIYYLNGSGTEVEISSKTLNLDTDAFGVFSYVIDPLAINSPSIANNQAFLRIKKGLELISDEKLRHVPYAIAANNGVPMGSIMPFLGTTAPPGWAMCKGQAWTSLPSGTNYNALKTFLGNSANLPNLQGTFLRGTGLSPVNSQPGPALMATQDSQNKSHNHGPGNLRTDNSGNHNHLSGIFNSLVTFNGANTTKGVDSTPGELNLHNGGVMPAAGAHSHAINSGVTGASGGLETRPVSYGVNYIIKL
ncbi:MAG: phage tail protein [Flavobacteriaceae bacterium]